MPNLNASQLNALLSELDAKAGEIDATSGAAAGPIWGAVHKLLLKSPIDNREAMRIVGSRDVGLLRQAIEAMRRAVGEGTGSQVAAAGSPATSPPTAMAVDPETLKEAMRAFRKRLKLVKLDHESRLSSRALTSGKKADFLAILPPQEYAANVWQALAAEGKLRDAGGGFYMLAEEPE